MKNVAAVSFVGVVAGALALPSLVGPVHFQITRPYSLHGSLPPTAGGGNSSVILGTVPLDFILTDVMVGDGYRQVIVTVNGTPMFNCGVMAVDSSPGSHLLARGNNHLSSGVFIQSGSQIGVEAKFHHGYGQATPVTLAGYVQ